MRRGMVPRLLIIGASVYLLTFIFAVTVAGAQDFRTGTNVTVAKSQTLDKSLFASGRTLDIAGTVKGDVFCAGQSITISGKVTGDVICAGQNVRIAGTVGGDIRVAGQTVALDASVAGNLTVAAQQFSSSSQSKVAGDAEIGATDINLNGAIGRDLAVAGSSVTIASSIGRDVTGTMQDLSLSSKANIGGDVVYTSDNKLQQSSGSQVAGQVSQRTPRPQQQHHTYGSIVGVSLALALYTFVALLLLALALVLLVPRLFQAATTMAIRHMGKTFLIGFLATILVPLVIVALMISVIGIPLALLTLLVWILLLSLSGPMAAYLAGRFMLRKVSDNAIFYMLAGGAVLLLLYFIPFFGIGVVVVSVWFGLGAILLMLRHIPRPSYDTARYVSGHKDSKTVTVRSE